MGTHDLLLVLAGLLAGALAITGLRQSRSSFAPKGYWAFAWAALTASGGFSLLSRSMPGISPVSAALGALFSPLMVAGALQHVGLPVPRWLLPAAGVLSLVGLMSHMGVENGNIEQYESATRHGRPP